MNIRPALILIILFLFFFITNCEKSDPKIHKNFTVSEISVNELNNLIKTRKGRGLLVNIWATWCIPCKEEFPDLIKVVGKYSEKIELIGISIDYPDEVESKIIPFLSEFHPNFINYVSTEKDIGKFINNLNLKWSGAIPATFFYDSDGKQYFFHQGKMSFEDIDKKIN